MATVANVDYNNLLIEKKETESITLLAGTAYTAGMLVTLQNTGKYSSAIVINPEDNKLIFNDLSSDDMWRSILEDMGGRYSMYSKYPEDPRLN